MTKEGGWTIPPLLPNGSAPSGQTMSHSGLKVIWNLWPISSAPFFESMCSSWAYMIHEDTRGDQIIESSSRIKGCFSSQSFRFILKTDANKFCCDLPNGHSSSVGPQKPYHISRILHCCISVLIFPEVCLWSTTKRGLWACVGGKIRTLWAFPCPLLPMPAQFSWRCRPLSLPS